MTSGLAASAVTIFSEDFEAFSTVAVNRDDTADADPAHPGLMIIDDNPEGGANESGVQVVNWQAHLGKNALLLRANSEAQVHFNDTRQPLPA